MKPLKKHIIKTQQKLQSVSAGASRPQEINITLVSAKERDIYRVPTYGYILP